LRRAAADGLSATRALARNWIAISRQSACMSRSTISAARMRTGLYVSYAHERLVGGRLVEPGEIITIDFSGGPQRGDAGPKDLGHLQRTGCLRRSLAARRGSR